MEFREIDMALIKEASKVSPDFAEMERLVREGADVNATSDSTFSNNVLSEVIFGSYSEEDDLPKSDSLTAVIEFFLKHGFDPSRDKGRAGAKCLANLTWSPCMASKIPTMKLLLDAGFRNIPAWDDKYDPEDGLPIKCIGGEASFQNFEDDFDAANTFESLYEILLAHEEGRPYSGIDRYDAAYGGVLKRVFVSEPKAGAAFFTLNEPTSKHRNCFRGDLYLEFDKGWLKSEGAHSLVFDTERPHAKITDVSGNFASIIGDSLAKVEFSQNTVVHGTTHYGQNIIMYNFASGRRLSTQTNFGEIPGGEVVGYYTIGNDDHEK